VHWIVVPLVPFMVAAPSVTLLSSAGTTSTAAEACWLNFGPSSALTVTDFRIGVAAVGISN